MDESVPEIAGDEMGGVVRSWRAEVGMDEDEDAGCLLMIHDMRWKSFEMAKEAGARAITVTNTIRGMVAITRCLSTFCRCSHPRIAYAPNITPTRRHVRYLAHLILTFHSSCRSCPLLDQDRTNDDL